MTLILASKSQSRRKILEQSGLKFRAIASNLDENNIKHEMLAAGKSFPEIAVKLASEKAMKISHDHPNDIIIGGDQILSCEGILFSKAKNIEEARKNLLSFRGKTHTLITSVVLALGDKIIWHYTSEPQLRMRKFSDQFLEEYLQNAGDALTASVGSYFIEDIGIQLFSDINGEYNDILGLPLMPLLKKLRELKIINE